MLASGVAAALRTKAEALEAEKRAAVGNEAYALAQHFADELAELALAQDQLERAPRAPMPASAARAAAAARLTARATSQGSIC